MNPDNRTIDEKLADPDKLLWTVKEMLAIPADHPAVLAYVAELAAAHPGEYFDEWYGEWLPLSDHPDNDPKHPANRKAKP